MNSKSKVSRLADHLWKQPLDKNLDSNDPNSFYYRQQMSHNNSMCPMVSFGSRKELDAADLVIDFDDLKLVNLGQDNSNYESFDCLEDDRVHVKSSQNKGNQEPFVLL